MLRRSFRVGLFLGVLAGLAFALMKALQARRETGDLAPRPAPTWPPLRDTAPPSPPPAPPAEPAPAAPEPPRRVEEPDDTTPATVVAEPVTPPPDEPHEEEVTEAPSPAARVSKSAKKTRKASKKTARTAAKKATTPPTEAAPAWVEPSGSVCPQSHPVKAKMASRIFHLPGQLNYERTAPDRCYRDGDAATADGLRQSKR